MIVLGPIAIERGAKVSTCSIVIRSFSPEATIMGVPARIAEPQPSIYVDQLDHNKLPDPLLSLVSQMLEG